MGKILTEADLRSMRLSEDFNEVHVGKDVFVTELAMDYMKKHGIRLVRENTVCSGGKTMSYTPIKKNGAFTYVDAETGKGYAQKPENMTHLRGNVLVKKTDPRIEFRGKLDTLQAQILCAQAAANREGENSLVKDLSEILEFTREILGAEVKDIPVKRICIFGLDSEQIRERSHNVKKYFGINHPIPDYTMGESVLTLNLLRAQVREAEISAAKAFNEERTDIIEALNRLSSAVYILECKTISGREVK